MSKIQSEDHPTYAPGKRRIVDDDAIIAQALDILARRLTSRRAADGAIFSAPEEVKAYAQLRWAAHEREVFSVLLLDTRHRLIAVVELFLGTVDSASVHPREVVKAALSRNASAVILVHNHPSGIPEPSQADIAITRKLVEALAFVEVRVLDHVVVGEGAVSMAERGLM